MIFILLMFNTVLVSYVFIYFSSRSKVWVFSPISMACLGLFLMYVLRPIYIMKSGEWGVEFNYKYSLDSYESVFFDSLLYCSICVFVFLFPFVIFSLVNKRHNKVASFKIIALDNCFLNRFSCCFLGVLCAVFFSLILSKMTLLSYIQGLGSRQVLLREVFGVYAFYFTGLFFLLHSVVLLKFSNDLVVSGVVSRISVIYIIMTIILFMLLGGRSNILFFLINICFVYLFIAGGASRKVKRVIIYSGITFFLIFGIAYRVFLRDVNFEGNQGKDPITLVLNNIFGLFDFIVGGGDFAQIDAMMMILNNPPSELLFGGTIVACIVSFIPRFLWESKPSGAMNYFTEYYFPWHYDHSLGGEFIVSWFGELVLNFGLLGCLLFVFLSSLVVLFFEVRILARVSNVSVIVLVVYSLISVRFFNVLKADIFNNYMAFCQLIFIPMVFYMLKKKG